MLQFFFPYSRIVREFLMMKLHLPRFLFSRKSINIESRGQTLGIMVFLFLVPFWFIEKALRNV